MELEDMKDLILESDCYKCNEGCHDWYRINTKDNMTRSGDVFQHTNDQDIKTKARFINYNAGFGLDIDVDDEKQFPSYTEIVDKVIDDEVLNNIIRGTNMHGALDWNFDQIEEGITGRLEIKVFIAILIVAGMTKGNTADLWSGDNRKGYKRLTAWMSLRRFRAIKNHICFNETWIC